MSYFVDKITTLKTEAQGEIYFMELDRKNFPGIYIKGLRHPSGQDTKLHLFHTTKKEDLYSFPEGFDVCFLEDLKPPICNNKPNKKYYYDINDSFIDNKTRIKFGKTYIYCPQQQIFIVPEIYDSQKKMRLNYYQVTNQNTNITLSNIKTENMLEITESALLILNIKLLPKSNIIILIVGWNRKKKIVFIDINNQSIVKSWEAQNINIGSIILENYVSINMINNSTWSCVLYDYQNNEKVINREGQIINTNDHSTSNRWLQDESIIIIQKENSREIYKLRDVDELPDDKKCVVCFQITDRSQALVPCGHTQFCSNCIKKFTTCPICRAEVTTCIKIY